MPNESPLDEHDRRLRELTRPPHWQAPKPAALYNLVVIGGGTAGLVAAMGAAGLGARVALCESRLLGGDCLVSGCVPSKALLSVARSAANARSAQRFGVEAVSPPEFARAMSWLREARARIAPHDSAERLKSAGVDVFFGHARFTSSSSVELDGTRLNFKRALIAVGARARRPDIAGLASAEPLDSESVFDLEQLPARLAVLGGGPIGCELGQAFARLGSRVTLFELGPRLMPRDEAPAAALVADQLRDDGVELRLETQLESVEAAAGVRRLHYRGPNGAGELEVDQILVATGRSPDLGELGLEAAGVRVERGAVLVDDRLQSSNRQIYAAGDCAGGVQFTHAADAMARLVLKNALFFGRARWSQQLIPWCTYTDPEVAHAGLSSYQAAQRAELREFCVELSDNDRALIERQARGYARVFADRRGRVHSATVVGPHAGELIGELSLLMTTGLSLVDLANTVHPYPTHAEALKRLGDDFQRTRLKPWLARWLSAFFRWQRGGE